MRLYDHTTVDEFPWPENPEAQRIKAFLVPFMKEGPQKFIDNIQTRLYLLRVGQDVVPITVNETHYDNCFVCSPYSQYVSRAEHEIQKTSYNPVMKQGLITLVKLLGIAFKQGKINKVVLVNNWLWTTTLHPSFTSQQIRSIVELLQQCFPRHAILFRSIYPEVQPEICHSLKENGFRLIASRQAYFFDGRIEENFQTRIFKSDLKLLEQSGYEVIDQTQLRESDAPRLAALYAAVYLEKYSKHNLQLNERFFDFLIKNPVLSIRCLRKNGSIDAVGAYYCCNGVMTTPMLGYDTTLPKELGLYRQMSAVFMLEAKKLGVIFNQSSGAQHYKQIRRAVGQMEYLAVLTRHLNVSRKAPWALLQSAMNSVGKAVIHKLEV